MEDQMPKDEYMQNYIAAKVEAKKIMTHGRFEECVNRFWQLLRIDPGCDLSKMTVTKPEYTGLMKRIYKVLLPIYREKEMAQEIEQEWLQDSVGHSELTLHLFTKVLFKIAHQWATHISVDEYCELLNKIYQRVTCRKVMRARDSSALVVMPTIQCEINAPVVEGPDPFASSE
jgi:hypothetical protein